MFKTYWYQLCLAKPFFHPTLLQPPLLGHCKWTGGQISNSPSVTIMLITRTQTHRHTDTHSALLPYITYKDSGSSCRPTTHRWVHSSSSQLIANESNVTLLVSESTDSHHQHTKAATTKTNVLLIVIGKKPNGRVPSWASFWHGFVIAL